LRKARKIFSWVIVGAFSVASIFLYRTFQLGRGDAAAARLENLNPSGELLGPEGICLDARGNLLVADTRGLIWDLGRGGTARIHARLIDTQESNAPEFGDALARVGGLAADDSGNLYASLRQSSGSALYRIDPARNADIFARDVGAPGPLALAKDRRSLWLVDGDSNGRLLHFPLAAPAPVKPDLIIHGLRSPSGVALGSEDRTIYASEMYAGTIVEIRLGETKPVVSRISDLKGRLSMGSLKGLAFDPRDQERRILYVAENLRGMFTLLDVKSRPPRIVKRLSLTLMGGRLCPGGMFIQDGYLYLTDLWSCSPLRLALGMPKWQTHAYRFRTLDPAAFYQIGF
jgi:sugar lactone lactonase YvrE